MKRQNLRTVSLIVGTFTYLLIGAAIFGYLESDHENRQREIFSSFESSLVRKYNISEEDHAALTTFILKSASHKAGIQWKFPGAFYFATTVVTTIGYGHSTPSTMGGRCFCMFYALIGIPLGLVMFQSIGERLNTFVKVFLGHAKRCFKAKNPEVTQTNLVTVVLALSTILMTVMAAVFARAERWDYFDALYYCFITLTTIGFGDYVALQKDHALQENPKYVVLSLVFILFGLSVVSSAVNLLVLKFLTLNTEDERRDEQLRYTANLNPILLEGDVITPASRQQMPQLLHDKNRDEEDLDSPSSRITRRSAARRHNHNHHRHRSPGAEGASTNALDRVADSDSAVRESDPFRPVYDRPAVCQHHRDHTLSSAVSNSYCQQSDQSDTKHHHHHRHRRRLHDHEHRSHFYNHTDCTAEDSPPHASYMYRSLCDQRALCDLIIGADHSSSFHSYGCDNHKVDEDDDDDDDEEEDDIYDDYHESRCPLSTHADPKLPIIYSEPNASQQQQQQQQVIEENPPDHRPTSCSDATVTASSHHLGDTNLIRADPRPDQSLMSSSSSATLIQPMTSSRALANKPQTGHHLAPLSHRTNHHSQHQQQHRNGRRKKTSAESAETNSWLSATSAATSSLSSSSCVVAAAADQLHCPSIEERQPRGGLSSGYAAPLKSGSTSSGQSRTTKPQPLIEPGGEVAARATTTTTTKSTVQRLACKCCCKHLECIQHALSSARQTNFLVSDEQHQTQTRKKKREDKNKKLDELGDCYYPQRDSRHEQQRTDRRLMATSSAGDLAYSPSQQQRPSPLAASTSRPSLKSMRTMQHDDDDGDIMSEDKPEIFSIQTSSLRAGGGHFHGSSDDEKQNN